MSNFFIICKPPTLLIKVIVRSFIFSILFFGLASAVSAETLIDWDIKNGETNPFSSSPYTSDIFYGEIATSTLTTGFAYRPTRATYSNSLSIYDHKELTTGDERGFIINNIYGEGESVEAFFKLDNQPPVVIVPNNYVRWGDIVLDFTTSFGILNEISYSYRIGEQLENDGAPGYNKFTCDYYLTVNTSNFSTSSDCYFQSPTYSSILTIDLYTFSVASYNHEVSYIALTDYVIKAENNEGLKSNYETKFLSATLTASGTLSAVVDYYIDTDDFVGQYDRPDVVLINISNSDTTQFEQKKKLILPLLDGNASTTINFSEIIPDGEYTAQIIFWNLFSQKPVLNRSYLTINFSILSGAVFVQNVVDDSDGIFPLPVNEYEECGITALSGCLNNSLRFLFYPSTESIQSVTSQYEALQTKMPFVYIYQASDIMTGLYTGTSDVIPEISVTTGIGSITFISQAQVQAIPYVSLLRSLIGAGLWLMLFTLLYRKTLSIHDKQTI